MRYDVEADWQLLNTCNYRCDYCFFSPAVLGEKLRRYASPAEWRGAFDATGLTWLLHMTGGEPTIYPGFADLCALLTERHFISLNSNLTQSALGRFASIVDPARVSFINAGWHDDERQARGGMAVFLQNATVLLERNFPLLVSVVATPAVLADMQAVAARVAALGIAPFPKLLRGVYKGLVYPGAYTAGEREIFRTFAQRAQEGNAARMAAWPGGISIDLRQDEAMLDGIPDFTGRNCGAGQKFVKIEIDGEAFRCSSKTPLGNVLNGTLQLRPAASPCDTDYCPYFCLKYTAPTPNFKNTLHALSHTANPTPVPDS